MNVLIEFYDSEEPILNLLSCMALKPDVCVFLGEERIRRQKSQRSLINPLKIAEINTSLRFVAVNIFDFEEICTALNKLLEEYRDTRCIVDVCGGNDLLLLAAGTLLLSMTVAAFSSMAAAYRLSRVDPGTALREGN